MGESRKYVLLLLAKWTSEKATFIYLYMVKQFSQQEKKKINCSQVS